MHNFISTIFHFREELLKYSFTKPPSWKHPFYQQLKVIVAVSEDDSPIFIKESQNCAKVNMS